MMIKRVSSPRVSKGLRFKPLLTRGLLTPLAAVVNPTVDPAQPGLLTRGLLTPLAAGLKQATASGVYEWEN